MIDYILGYILGAVLVVLIAALIDSRAVRRQLAGLRESDNWNRPGRLWVKSAALYAGLAESALRVAADNASLEPVVVQGHGLPSVGNGLQSTPVGALGPAARELMTFLREGITDKSVTLKADPEKVHELADKLTALDQALLDR